MNVAPEMSAGVSLPVAGALGQVAPLHRDGGQVAFVGLVDHRHDHAVVHRHGEPDLHLGVRLDPVANPAGVHPRMLLQHARDERGQQIGVGELHAGGLFDCRPELRADGDERAAVDLARHEEVRNRRPALGRPLGHQPPDRAERFSGAGRRAGGAAAPRRERAGHGERRSGGCALRRRLHIVGDNLAVRARIPAGG